MYGKIDQGTDFGMKHGNGNKNPNSAQSMWNEVCIILGTPKNGAQKQMHFVIYKLRLR